MKRFKLFGIITFLVLLIFSFVNIMIAYYSGTNCDIQAFYEGVSVNSGTLALTRSGSLEEIELVLEPTKINIGNYEVSVTRKGKDLYKIDNKNIYIKTRYCYAYSYSQKAIIVVESIFGYNKGKIIFQ